MHDLQGVRVGVAQEQGPVSQCLNPAWTAFSMKRESRSLVVEASRWPRSESAASTGRGKSAMFSSDSTVFFTWTEMMATTSSGLAGRSSCSDSTDTLVTKASSSSRQKKGAGSGFSVFSGCPSSAPCGTRRPSSSVFSLLSRSPPLVISAPRGCCLNSRTETSA